jgi:amidase
VPGPRSLSSRACPHSALPFVGGPAARLSSSFWPPGCASPPPPAPRPPFELKEATIASIQQAFADGTLTCVDLATASLARIAAYDDAGPKLNAVTTVNPKALEVAAALDAERAERGPRGPLHCIPVLLKDNVDTADMPTSNGSVLLKDSVPPDDAHLAKAIREAGALILGKSAMGEFAGGSYNTIDGQALNPYNFKRTTGGSSSGSGAAVSANFAVLAIGTDTSTSVRGPAAFNGIVGLRPTTGLISRDGVAPKNLEFDTAGPMARTVTDVAHLLNVIAFPDPDDPVSERIYEAHPFAGKTEVGGRRGYTDYTQHLKTEALKGARLGVVRDFFGGDPEIDALAETALGVLRAQGAELVDIQLDPAFVEFHLTNGGDNFRIPADYRFREDWERYLTTLGPTVPKTVAEFVRRYETEVNKSALPVENSVLNLLKRSLTTSSRDADYQILVMRRLPEATRLKLEIFHTHKVDALVFPYQSNFAVSIANPTGSVPDPTFVSSNRPNPAIFAGYSSLGFPGLVVPMGFGSQGLPMALSFMGRPYEEGRLLGYGFAYEQATRLRKPSPLLP